jgi:hypothetical protein
MTINKLKLDYTGLSQTNRKWAEKTLQIMGRPCTCGRENLQWKEHDNNYLTSIEIIVACDDCSKAIGVSSSYMEIETSDKLNEFRFEAAKDIAIYMKTKQRKPAELEEIKRRWKASRDRITIKQAMVEPVQTVKATTKRL